MKKEHADRRSATGIGERMISLGPGLPPLPERLLLAQARGEVLFIAGAGVSQPAGLPDFRGLVVKVYRRLDRAVHDIIGKLPGESSPSALPDLSSLSPAQAAEVRRFASRDYDVVLGMLERRMDGPVRTTSVVRQAIAEELRDCGNAPAAVHRSLLRLADRGRAVTLVTTNFDRLLEAAGKSLRPKLQTYSLSSIPRPSRADFAGILHVHGVLDADSARTSELIVSDQDFGEYYLRRRVVPDFIYDAARLFHLVLVGYSANDPPMRYLLNAVAADGTRFLDLKERFTFLGTDKVDPIELEDWNGRGITPIPYNSADGHVALQDVLERWTTLSRNAGERSGVEAEVKRIARLRYGDASSEERDLFAHLFRRSNPGERTRLSALASAQKGDIAWLDMIAAVALESDRGHH
jgi:hypothetical protein